MRDAADTELTIRERHLSDQRAAALADARHWEMIARVRASRVAEATDELRRLAAELARLRRRERGWLVLIGLLTMLLLVSGLLG